MGFTSRAALLVLAAALVLCSGLASAARTKRGRHGGDVVAPASPPLDDEAGAGPAPYWRCRRIVEPFGPCEQASCKASCSQKYKGQGVCIGKPEGCQCTYCPLPWTPPTAAAAADGPALVGY